MVTSLYRVTVFALYQFSIVLGITLLPVALAANRAGIPIPIGQLIERLEAAYRNADEK